MIILTQEICVLKGASKTEKYQTLIPQLNFLVGFEKDQIANLSNIIAALKMAMNYFWVGCYFVKGNDLVLGPFQGFVACTRIKKGRGVCGKAFEDNQIIVVDNVDNFPGHIACSSESKSEIVLPARTRLGEVFMVLDVDSDKLSDFDDVDRKYLSQVITIIESLYN